jgi:endonuclease/exonuclease/phosphatase family metal-dependent hydrolase
MVCLFVTTEAHGGRDPAVIVCGDFNATPGSALYTYMQRGPEGVVLSYQNRTLYASLNVY